MDSVDVINKINSNYIINDLFNYVKDINFKFRFFLYSKYHQKKLNINLSELQEKYLKKMKFYIDKYVYISFENFSDLLAKGYLEFFERKKLDRTKVENMIYDIYQNKTIKDLDDDMGYDAENNNTKINVYSPLFNLLSKKNFENIFTIYMNPTKDSKDNYIKIFMN